MEGVAGILLAGGRSQRMGRDKASLPWHGSTLARRAAGLLARCSEPPVIVVCAPDQELPPLPGWVEVVRDPEPGLGPLAGLATGLAAAGPRAEVAAVCAVDAPLAHPAVLAALLGALGTAPAVVPLADGSPQPLFAVYRTELAFLAAALVADGRRRASALGERSGARMVEPFELLVVDDIAAFDPQLASFRSFDDPAAYDTALAVPQPLVTVTGDLAGPRELRASTVGRARRLLLAEVAPQLAAAIPVDDETPLFAGDVLVPAV
ncbi:MAG TPA: NTP transferase domain-containing protein [Gaiellales bacterium]|jgi:molybdopterin-guanine dinucleotide biosynthesis protein A|nr:NTP transferase domain-containing protein [Gaiellales bacterium]